MMKACGKFLALLLAAALCFAGCSTQPEPGNTTGSVTPTHGDNTNLIPSGTPGTPVHLDFEKTDDEMLSVQEYILAPGTPTFTVICNGNTVTADTDAVRCQNGIVTRQLIDSPEN